MRLNPSKIALLLALCALLLLGLVPPAREGAKLLMNDLFALSEARNAYAYDRFAVAETAGRLPACALLAAFCVGFAAFVACCKSRLPALLTACALAVFQAYFGVSLPTPVNVVLFGLLGLKMITARALRHRLACGACALSAALIVGLFLPGVHAATEAASEQARDWLGHAAQVFETGMDAPPEATQTRHENHLSLSTGGGSAQAERDYRLVTRTEQQISDPPWFDLIKTALMLLLILLLLALPFAPFVLLSRRAGQARAIREAFDDPDAQKAVCAMFRHIVRYWAACRDVPKGLPFSGLPDAVEMPETYAADYRACAAIFLKAAYGHEPVSQAERDGVKFLLDETERLLYDGQSAVKQLELKYRYLL